MTNYHVMQDAIAAAQRVAETGIPMSSDDIQILARRAGVPTSTFAAFGKGGAATIAKRRPTLVVKARAGGGFDLVEDTEAETPLLVAIAKARAAGARGHVSITKATQPAASPIVKAARAIAKASSTSQERAERRLSDGQREE